MKVYALVGKSGTGKSYQAVNLCKEKNIESIIDDGLFICGNDIMAGTSAKREITKVGAIKTALFTKDEHMREVTEKIREVAPQSLLIIGTSDGMVDKINERLKLPPISEKIYIEEITTEGEREIAEKQRLGLGQHVVPVPTFQLKRQFSGYFLSPLRIFKGWSGGRGGDSEKSVVRPTYSYLGDYTISDKVISDIVEHTTKNIDSIDAVLKTITETRGDGLAITVLVNMKYEAQIIEGATELQKQCIEQIEEMTAFNMDFVNVEIRGIK